MRLLLFFVDYTNDFAPPTFGVMGEKKTAEHLYLLIGQNQIDIGKDIVRRWQLFLRLLLFRVCCGAADFINASLG